MSYYQNYRTVKMTATVENFFDIEQRIAILTSRLSRVEH